MVKGNVSEDFKLDKVAQIVERAIRLRRFRLHLGRRLDNF